MTNDTQYCRDPLILVPLFLRPPPPSPHLHRSRSGHNGQRVQQDPRKRAAGFDWFSTPRRSCSLCCHSSSDCGPRYTLINLAAGWRHAHHTMFSASPLKPRVLFHFRYRLHCGFFLFERKKSTMATVAIYKALNKLLDSRPCHGSNDLQPHLENASQMTSLQCIPVRMRRCAKWGLSRVNVFIWA